MFTHNNFVVMYFVDSNNYTSLSISVCIQISSEAMVEHVAGLISVVVFYILILIAGIIASRKKAASGKLDDVILANRSIGLWLSFFTLSGKYIYLSICLSIYLSIAMHILHYVYFIYIYIYI